MRIGGFQKFSLIDYPDVIAAVVFTQGCNFRCPYCYNPELVYPDQYNEIIPEKDVLVFLKKRHGKLQGVVVTGGEPTQQKDLVSFLYKIKCLGYLVKLDTNGSHPDILKKLIGLRLVNYIAMDIKAPLCKYSQAAGAPCDIDNIRKSIEVIIESKFSHQFRTTLVKPLCSEGDLPKIVGSIRQAQRYVVQRFVPSEKILNKRLLSHDHYSNYEFNVIKLKWERIFNDVSLSSSCQSCCLSCQEK